MYYSNNKLCVDCCDRHQLDQTPTLGGRSLVEISTKRRHPQCRNFDQTSNKLRPNFDQTSTPPVSKFGRSLLGMSMKYIVTLIKMSTKLRHQTSTKLRPNFDQTSTPHRSKSAMLSNHISYCFQNISYCLTTLQQHSCCCF